MPLLQWRIQGSVSGRSRSVCRVSKVHPLLTFLAVPSSTPDAVQRYFLQVQGTRHVWCTLRRVSARRLCISVSSQSLVSDTPLHVLRYRVACASDRGCCSRYLK